MASDAVTHSRATARPVPATARPLPRVSTPDRATTALLACGAVAGPLFIAVAAAQVLTRDGFDLSRHPLSLLSLGDLGWIQITNFVVAGLLSIAGAVGLRRAADGAREGAGPGTWIPRLVGAHGIGLVLGGVFVADPSMGYPAGAPEGPPEQLSWHAILHGVAPLVAFLSLVAACVLLARRYSGAGRRGRAALSAGCGLAVVLTAAWPHQDSVPERLAAATVLAFGWLTVLMVRAAAGAGTERA